MPQSALAPAAGTGLVPVDSSLAIGGVPTARTMASPAEAALRPLAAVPADAEGVSADDPGAPIRGARAADWFAAFEARTTEKPATRAALSAVIAALDAAALLPPDALRFLDLGCGPGGLLGSTLDRLAKGGRAVDGHALDIEPRHVAEARIAAAGRADVRPGDAFAPAPAIRAALGLPPTATIDLLLAAHVGYYAPDLGRWETTLQRLIGATGVALILQEAAFAPFSARLNPVSGVRRTAALRRVLTARRRPHAVVGFRAGVRLPPLTGALIDSLAAAPSLEAGGDPHAGFEDGLAARHLAEFLIQRPLETVTPGDRRRYLEELRGLADDNDGLVPIDNALIVLLPARGGDRARAAAKTLEARLTAGRGTVPAVAE